MHIDSEPGSEPPVSQGTNGKILEEAQEVATGSSSGLNSHLTNGVLVSSRRS